MTDHDFRAFVDEVKRRHNIVEVVSRYVTLNAQNKGLCPFHDDKDPSFHVKAKGQFFKCFGCGEGGDVIKFVQLIRNMTFREALAALASEVGLTVATGKTRR